MLIKINNTYRVGDWLIMTLPQNSYCGAWIIVVWIQHERTEIPVSFQLQMKWLKGPMQLCMMISLMTFASCKKVDQYFRSYIHSLKIFPTSDKWTKPTWVLGIYLESDHLNNVKRKETKLMCVYERQCSLFSIRFWVSQSSIVYAEIMVDVVLTLPFILSCFDPKSIGTETMVLSSFACRWPSCQLVSTKHPPFD